MMNNGLRPYDEYSETGINWIENIPSTWKIVKNSVLFREIVDTGHSELELLSILQNKGIVKQSSTGRKIRKAEENQSYKRICKGDIGYNLMNAFMGAIGASKYEGIISPAYAVCRPKIDINVWYYHYLFRTEMYKSEFNKNSYGIMYERNRLYFDRFKNINAIIPPRSEQDQIVKYLDYKLAKINKFIRAKKKLIEALKEQIECYVYGSNNSLYKDITSWESSFPIEWKMVKASKLTNERSIKNKGEFELLAVTQDRGVVLKKDCEQKYVSPAGDLNGLKLVCSGDYVISLRSFQGGIEFSNVEGIVSPAYNVFSLVKEYGSKEYKHYYKYLFKTKAFISLLNTVVSGIRDGKNINYSDFAKLLLPVPPRNVACKIYELSVQIEKLQNEFNKQFLLINEYKTTLISDVVTGKIDVRHIEVNEPEEENIEETDFDDISIDEDAGEAEESED